MKKVITMALCLTAVGSLSAQKVNVDNAKKLSGKFDKIEEARTLIRQAMENPETANDAQTYYVAGKIEFDAYDKGLQAGMINPEDPSANPEAMAQELLNGYNYFLKALPLDSVPNEKGEIKPKVSKDIVNKISGHTNDFFAKAGATMYEMKKYYPEAYQSFMIYADMPDQAFLGNKAPKLDDTSRALAYFNAGLSAYVGNELIDAANAFRKARNFGYNDEESNGANAYVYEIACWQNLMQRDTTMNDEAQARIMDVAKAGNEKFGIAQPVFLNNLVNAYVIAEDFDNALNTVNNLLAANPENSNLYGLRGFIYDRMEKDNESLADYGKAAALPDCDYETLKNAAKKIYRVGAVKFGQIDPNDQAAKNRITTEYYDQAMSIAKRAKAMNASDSDIDHVIDAIDYALTTYFPAN